MIAVAATVGLYAALPPGLTIGPRWSVPATTGVLVVATVISHRGGRHDLDRILGFTLTSAITLEMIISLGLLVAALPSHRERPTRLLLSAASLWSTN